MANLRRGTSISVSHDFCTWASPLPRFRTHACPLNIRLDLLSLMHDAYSSSSSVTPLSTTQVLAAFIPRPCEPSFLLDMLLRTPPQILCLRAEEGFRWNYFRLSTRDLGQGGESYSHSKLINAAPNQSRRAKTGTSVTGPRLVIHGSNVFPVKHAPRSRLRYAFPMGLAFPQATITVLPEA